MPKLRKRGLGPMGFRFAESRARAILNRSGLGLKRALRGRIHTMGSKRLYLEASGFPDPANRRSLGGLVRMCRLDQPKASLQVAGNQQHIGNGRPVPAVLSGIFTAYCNISVPRPPRRGFIYHYTLRGYPHGNR